jgi:nucleoside-diphosphate-sugar epimerase
MSGMQRKIAVIGANGFVGSQICRAIDLIPKYSLIKILRESNLSDGIKQADIIIHAANPAGRFRAESNPEQDFSATVDKTYEILSHCGDKKLVLISSLSCRTQMNINYGRNRRMCELLALAAHGTVVRLGPMFGT